ncbi:MAG: hypothetical protein ABH827_04530 [bacterium]
MTNLTKKFLLLISISVLFFANTQAMLETTVKHLSTCETSNGRERENEIDPARVFFNNNYPVALTSNKIKILNPRSGKQLTDGPFKYFQAIPKRVKNFAFRLDGKMFAFTHTNGNSHIIEIHSLETIPSKKKFKIPSADPCLAFSQDGSILAVGTRNNIIIRDTRNLTPLKKLESGPNPSDSFQIITISPNNKLIAAGTGDKICSAVKLLNIKTKETSTLRPYDGSIILDIVFINNKHLAISSAQEVNVAPTITIWNVETGKCIANLTGLDSQASSIACNSQGTILASGSSDGTVKLWDVSTWKCLKTIKDQIGLYSIALNNKGTLLATRSFGGKIMVYEIKQHYPMLDKNKLCDVKISCEQDQDTETQDPDQDPIEKLCEQFKNIRI